MKLAVVLVLLVAAAVKAGPAAPRKYGRYVFFPGGDGKLHLVDTQLKVPQQKVDVSEVTFQLYTQQNPDNYQRLIAGDVSSLGNFSPSRVTKFVTHGYTSNAGNFVDFKDAYLATGDYNVILVDWSGPAGGLYNVAKDNTVQVGGFLAELADFLVANGANPSNIHFIGHSLGAHVSGCAGGRTGAYIGKIIGLDPAGVLYGGEDLLDRLDSSDAAVVEVVHTNGGLLGWFDPMGTADFYPNGGDWQPGCDFDITGSCSHSRANAYLVESIYSNNFVAHACGSWTDFQDGLCSGGATALMGEKPSPSPSGVYFLGVSDSSPYALDMFASDEEAPGDAGASIAAATSPEDVPETNENAVIRSRGKKRLRNDEKWLRNVRKKRRALGQEYTNRTGNLVPRKELRTISECSCRYECHKNINEDRQEKVFNEFYNLGNHDLQSAFLFTMIKVVDKSRSYVGQKHSRREKTKLYYLLNSNGSETRVCKRFFQNTLAVSAGRIDRVLKNKGEKSTPPRDGRGKGEPGNKTPSPKVDEVKCFIEKFPAYESHYAYHKNNGRKYLGPDLNLSIMYSLYCKENPMPVSHFIFRKIFYEKFNLSFHPTVSDSCRKCDALQVKITASDNDNEKTELIAEREFHQQKAEYARAGLRSDSLLSKSDGNVTVISFDLMKTLPTPVISTGVCYYKRQLWTYCFGIHNLQNDDAYMFLWNESIASRGPQEIGSCLLYFIRNFVRTEKLIMYSDQCGGQNRNIKVAVLCQYIVSSSEFSVKEIDHKFLVSGHSYLPCDQDFGLVQKRKKYFPNIFLPEDWNDVVVSAKKKNSFKVINMNAECFFSTKQLERNITNRKMSSGNSKVQWLNMQWLRFEATNRFKIFYKYSNQSQEPFQEIDVAKRTSTCISNLELLYPNGNVITETKKKDLLSLLQFVPPIYHDFYKNLKTSCNVVETLPILDFVDDFDMQNIA